MAQSEERKEFNRNPESNPLGTAPMMPLIFKYAIPSIISMLVMSAYNITDQIFIGHTVGMLGNAATNVAFPTVTFTTGIGMLFGVGTAANFSINQGAGKMDEAKKYVTSGLAGMTIAGLVVFLFVFLFKESIIAICGASKESAVFGYAYTYLSITTFGLPFHLFGNASSNIIRADGSPRYSMICVISGAVINVFLDWLFMYPFNMGIKGAAIATVIGQICSAGLSLNYFRKFKAFDVRFADIKLRWKYIKKSMITGIPNALNHMVMMLTNITLNNVLTTYGALSIYGKDIPLAVSGVAAKVNTIMVSFAVGTAQGCQPIWGFNLGAKNYKRVKGAYVRAFGVAFAIGAIFFIMLHLFPREIISIFGTGDEMYFSFAERYLTVYMMMVAFQNIQPVCVNYFSATGNPKQGTIVSLTRQGLFLIPLLIILPKFFGINGILAASPIADTAAFIMSISMVLLSFKKMDEKK